MKVSLNWLKEYLEIDSDPNVLAERIARTSVEVEDVTQPGAGMSGLVVAKVLSVEPHPDSDHMVITQVDAGEAEPIQIVTGAPNVAEGQLVILAKHNSRIGGGQKIKKGKLRGVASNGMLCALQEVGFDDKIAPKDFEDGIWVFNESDNVQPGDDALEVLGLNDYVLEMGITPNRADMLSMNGTAWEVGAMLQQTPKLPVVTVEETGNKAAAELISVHADAKLAPKYKVRVIENVTVQDSPLWLQRKLWNAGMRPINNIVDITNYVLLTFGQPMHAFDYAKLSKKELNVRLANEAETLVTLDGEKRDLRPGQDIVISDGETPIMLAGVMGGQSTGIDEKSTTVVLEAAIFNAHNVRATARRHDLHSEASQRFERGIDWNATEQALDFAANLVAQLGNANVQPGVVIATDQEKEAVEVTVSLSRINHVLGLDLAVDDVKAVFEQLQFSTVVNGEDFVVTIPSRRWDISIAADLIEEVARMYGYDNIPATLPVTTATVGKLTYKQQVIRKSRHFLESLGLNQAISYGLTTDKKAQMFSFDTNAEITKLDYPMTQDRTATRMSLITGLLDDVAYNIARKQQDVALYEQGRVFYRFGDAVRPTEIEHIAGAVTGKIGRDTWQVKASEADFYTVKGIVAAYLGQFNFKSAISYQATTEFTEMHPGRTAAIYVGDQLVGFVGQVHPVVAKEFKIKPTYVFELDLQLLIDLAKNDQDYKSISKFPSMSRDIAILVDEKIAYAQISEVIHANGGKHLVEVDLFDVYQGANVDSGKKSLAFTLTYQDASKTLVEEEVNTAFANVVAALSDQLAAEIR